MEYVKLDPVEHVLLRPDSYIGSIKTDIISTFVYENDIIIKKTIKYVPGLYKIFDEILVNASDNKQRTKTTKRITVYIDDYTISIENDGEGIPCEMHKEGVYIPTLIFGHLLTSSNFDDKKLKTTGGRNGYGAKLCNIFSKIFTVETVSNKLKFSQTWYDNMSRCDPPVITEYNGNSYTKITFKPDMERFGVTHLDSDIKSLLFRRVMDMTGVCNLDVILNNVFIKNMTFKKMCSIYIGDIIIYEKCNDRWEIACSKNNNSFHISFVNGIFTSRGGKHVDYITDQIVKKCIDILLKKRKFKGYENLIKPSNIKSNLCILVNCFIDNPCFDSQTKECMTSHVKEFGSDCKISSSFCEKIVKSLEDELSLNLKNKTVKELQKTVKKSNINIISKLDDAIFAGTPKSQLCSLILTEGDSAKSLVISGLSVIGREYYGVFPLKGKPLNVRDATYNQISKNEEINNVIKILGLNYEKQYTEEKELKTLRYGSLIIMADQDQDGSHIKGLIINFIHHNWPNLLKIGFLKEIITPIIKVKHLKEVISFYSIPEYEKWKNETQDSNKYVIKYYKGLGTSTSQEAKEYFKNLEKSLKTFTCETDKDEERVFMAFSKTQISQRKKWLEIGIEKTDFEKLDNKLSLSDFIDKELILFSHYDNVRSIPSLLDGLKPGQRKILFTCFKKTICKEIKVSSLAGMVSEFSAYHHGEVSLTGTIINMAADYIGSNNINLLNPIGQFGTRIHGGKDSASPRYISTSLNDITRLIFIKEDDDIIEHLYDEGKEIEPKFYIPIIPMILVNGSNGIGTGWMTYIPNYNPLDIIYNIKRYLSNIPFVKMSPWYKNFTGEIIKINDVKFRTYGRVNIINVNNEIITLEIFELPIGKWTQDYIDKVLIPMIQNKEIENYKCFHTDIDVKINVTLKTSKYDENNVHKNLKLFKDLSMTSMVLFDKNSKIKHYTSVEDILLDFCNVRLDYYEKRQKLLIEKLEKIVEILQSKCRFISEVCDKIIIIENTKKSVLEDLLREREYIQKNSSYKYLLSMEISSLTSEEKSELERKCNEYILKLNLLKTKTPTDMWIEDLDKLSESLIK